MKPDLKAVIDIGTNTFHLLIAHVDKKNNIEVIHRNTIAVKLGEGGVNKGFIADAAYQRGIDALLVYRQELDDYGIENVFATATAAVRDANNGQQFIDEALEKAKIKITLIDGLKEAQYIYEAVKGAGILNKETALIMDIGGGSVEFIICNQYEILFKDSYQLGAARLMADYYINDKAIPKQTLIEMEQLFENKTASLKTALEKYKIVELIGTAGSFDSYATITSIRNNETFNPITDRYYHFDLAGFSSLLNEIIDTNHQEREKMKGLIALRVDMILMASILTKYIVYHTNPKIITTCTYSLKEGLILSN